MAGTLFTKNAPTLYLLENSGYHSQMHCGASIVIHDSSKAIDVSPASRGKRMVLSTALKRMFIRAKFAGGDRCRLSVIK